LGGRREKKCRMCEQEEETYEHVWERCTRWGEEERESWQRVIGRMLGEKGEGEEWMKMIERMRVRGEKNEEESRVE